MLVIFNLIIFYLCGGILANILSADRDLYFSARIIMLLTWPWMFYINETPRMERWLNWAEKNGNK